MASGPSTVMRPRGAVDFVRGGRSSLFVAFGVSDVPSRPSCRPSFRRVYTVCYARLHALSLRSFYARTGHRCVSFGPAGRDGAARAGTGPLERSLTAARVHSGHRRRDRGKHHSEDCGRVGRHRVEPPVAAARRDRAPRARPLQRGLEAPRSCPSMAPRRAPGSRCTPRSTGRPPKTTWCSSDSPLTKSILSASTPSCCRTCSSRRTRRSRCRIASMTAGHRTAPRVCRPAGRSRGGHQAAGRSGHRNVARHGPGAPLLGHVSESRRSAPHRGLDR